MLIACKQCYIIALQEAANSQLCACVKLQIQFCKKVRKSIKKTLNPGRAGVKRKSKSTDKFSHSFYKELNILLNTESIKSFL